MVMEKKRICPRCFHILKGKPKRDEIDVPTGGYTTVNRGNYNYTQAMTKKYHTGKYWCGECRALGELSDFREFRIPKVIRKAINKHSKKLYKKGFDKSVRFSHLTANGVEPIL